MKIRNFAVRFYVLITLIVLVISYVAWWWVDSFFSCQVQDEHNLRGVCLAETRSRAEKGEKSAQWLYGNYLLAEGKERLAQDFHRKYFSQINRGLDLESIPLESYCAQKIPGFEAEYIELSMHRVAGSSPDAYLSILRFHLGNGCDFSLKKASDIIPKINQCAHATLRSFLRLSDNFGYNVTPDIRASIARNMVICAEELANPPLVRDRVVEVVGVRQQDIDEMRHILQTWESRLGKHRFN